MSIKLSNLLLLLCALSLTCSWQVFAQYGCVDSTLINLDYPCSEWNTPTCGCDGITYYNECHAEKYGGLTSYIIGTACDSRACIDTSLINLDYDCPAEVNPVCGCDGVTYGNQCEAINWGGVTSWTVGECTATICNPGIECGDSSWLWQDFYIPEVGESCGCSEGVSLYSWYGKPIYFFDTFCEETDGANVFLDCNGEGICAGGLTPWPNCTGQFLSSLEFVEWLWLCEPNTGLQETIEQIQLYPNPASDFLQIVSKTASIQSCLFYNLQGKLIKEQKWPQPSKEQTLNLREIPSGLYVLELQTEQGKTARKLQILK